MQVSESSRWNSRGHVGTVSSCREQGGCLLDGQCVISSLFFPHNTASDDGE